MRVAVLGGKLQGVEACYLARKAGWNIVLADKKENVPAQGMCDAFFQFDLLDDAKLKALLRDVDFVVPALEDKVVLDHIYDCAAALGKRVVYDKAAYALSSSKIQSDVFFQQMHIPAPRPWPHCRFPVTVKPSGASGSKHVRQVDGPTALADFLERQENREEWVVQEFLAGPSYSIEVIGDGQHYRTFQVTELEMDAGYDCKRVLAPAALSLEKQEDFAACALRLACELKLCGIMDVEVILHENELKVLEIDARLPSQTLIAVYQSTGVNMLEQLWRGPDTEKDEKFFTRLPGCGVVFEHIQITGDTLAVWGEHVMGGVGQLRLIADFFGADEAITNFREGEREWVATLVVTAETQGEAWKKSCEVIRNIMKTCGIRSYRDVAPAGFPHYREEAAL